MQKLRIRMLGQFTISAGEVSISDRSKRMPRVWSVMAYLIYHRGKMIPQKTLLKEFWNEDSSANPENVLRITLHRIRKQLDALWPGAGKELIINKEGCYGWNRNVECVTDYECFACLYTGADSQSGRLEKLLEVLGMYRGSFLEGLSSDLWVIPIAAHYENMFLCASREAAGLLTEQERFSEAAGICRNAIGSEPYHEPLYQMLIRCQAAAGDTEGAEQTYRALVKKLWDDFGIRPGEETRAVYREAVHRPGKNMLSMEAIMEELREKENASAALLCDYDYFKFLCYVESRAMARRGNPSHVALISVDSREDHPLTRRSIHRIVKQWGQVIGSNLRRADVYAQCSENQYIVLLSGADFENSCMVCRRLLAAFRKAHPHITAQTHYMVQPLGPGISVP